MKKIKNGFTLIEMIICIGIIAALGIIIGLNANTMLSKSNVSSYEDLMQEIFDATSIYAELSDTDCKISCDVKISNLVEIGLLDKSIYNKSNPVYKNPQNFVEKDVIIVERSSGAKEIIYKCNLTDSKYDLKSSNIKDYKYWEKC